MKARRFTCICDSLSIVLLSLPATLHGGPGHSLLAKNIAMRVSLLLAAFVELQSA